MRAIKNNSKKTAGYYFLLSCYTGWRISDAKKFNKAVINGGHLVVRAKKNGQIVSIPIYSKLKEVINFVIRHPFNMAEQTVRQYIKQIATDAGITKKINYKSSRHSFAMMLMANGFKIEEVAELIGDTILITKVYARVHNEILKNKIIEKFG